MVCWAVHCLTWIESMAASVCERSKCQLTTKLCWTKWVIVCRTIWHLQTTRFLSKTNIGFRGLRIIKLSICLRSIFCVMWATNAAAVLRVVFISKASTAAVVSAESPLLRTPVRDYCHDLSLVVWHSLTQIPLRGRHSLWASRNSSDHFEHFRSFQVCLLVGKPYLGRGDGACVESTHQRKLEFKIFGIFPIVPNTFELGPSQGLRSACSK